MGRKVNLTRRERFCAAHKLWLEEWDDEKNREVFGKCANPNWHGHNYVLFVTVRGEVDEKTGLVADLRDISTVIKERVIDKLDHKNIDLDVPFMNGRMSSTENVAIAIWDELKEGIEALGCELYRVKVQETENNFVEYYGD